MRVKIPFFPLGRYTSLEDRKKLSKEFINLLEKGNFILGDNVALFESEFAKIAGSKYAVSVGNGFDALKLSLKVFDFTAGSEVLVPANTFIATPLAVTDCNLKFIPVDVDYNSMNIDFKDLESKISKKTVAVIPVHLFGNPVDLFKLNILAKRYNLKIIEDCSQAHGSKFNEVPIGSSGNLCCFSLYPTKNLGAFGDAGIITTNSKSLYEKLLALRNYGSLVKYKHKLKGVNSRLDEVQAIFLSHRIKNFYKELNYKSKIAQLYLNSLDKNKFKLPVISKKCVSSWHLFVIKSQNRNALQSYLSDQGIQSIIHYPIPCHKQQCYSELNSYSLKTTEKLSKEILSIPLNPLMSESDVRYVIECMNKF